MGVACLKTKYWILLIAVLLAVCLGLSAFWMLPGGSATRAEVWSQGELLRTVDLTLDQEFTVTTPSGGTNTVTVKDGRIAVTEASCPDHYCMERGFCDSGTEIVCLPNRLVIRFVGEQEIDAVIG